MERSELIGIIEAEYERMQGKAEEKRRDNIKKYYEKCPSLKEIDEKINKTGLNSINKIIKDPKNAKKAKEELSKKLDELAKKRRDIMKENNIPDDYNSPSYECSLCSDTGYLPDGKRCSCFEKKLSRLYYKNSNLGKMIHDADIEKFDLSYYPEVSKTGGESPRKIVSEAVRYIIHFCKYFNEDIPNIYLYGNTGLGKTYLSAACAKNIMDQGKSVIYIRAPKMFSLYEEFKFKDYSLKDKKDELYECDLLVIDDLGSELITKTSISFFFDLLDERLINNKKMIINTNLDPASFSKNYTVRATSRIYDSFKIFRFEGEDIRLRKLMEKR